MVLTFITHTSIFIASLAALAKGADYFVEYSARIAKRIGVSDLVIGLTVTSIGTSLPELASSMSATIQGEAGIIIGSIIGSNIANIGLILGFSAIINPFKTDKKMHDRDGFVMLTSVLLFFVFILNNQIERWESTVFLIVYFAYILFIVRSEKENKEIQFRDFMQFVFDFEYVKPISKGLKELTKKRKINISIQKGNKVKAEAQIKDIATEIGILILSGISIIIGAKYLIREAVWAAKTVGIPESIIGLSMIAIGTSLPELLVSVSAIRKNKGGIVVGNVIGSNIANLFFILGTCGLIIPIQVPEIAVTLMTPILLFFSIALMMFIKSNWQITRFQGFSFVISYIIFISIALWRGWPV